MNIIDFKTLSKVCNDYDLFLFDLWGVIVEGAEIYPNSVALINSLIKKQRKVYFVSNAPRPGFNTAKKLKNWGIVDVKEQDVFTSGNITRKYLQESKERFNIDKPIIYHMGADRNDDILQNTNYELTTDLDKANIVLMSLYRDGHENRTEFDELLAGIAKRKIITICANPDTTIPLQGSMRYCAGYFANKVEKQGGIVIYTGKPHLQIYEEVLATVPNIAKDRILMIGDTFETDILGASNSGIHSALVMTGNASLRYNKNDSLDDQIKALSQQAYRINIIPNFITSLE
ncbi:MAG: TIGR01459 family HAD-type hydrolase [Rickettsiaceae bacterium]|nr:TIGR01459 family HAD-type hydrolase [Rickettsiaceae bacterium]